MSAIEDRFDDSWRQVGQPHDAVRRLGSSDALMRFISVLGEQFADLLNSILSIRKTIADSKSRQTYITPLSTVAACLLRPCNPVRANLPGSRDAYLPFSV